MIEFFDREGRATAFCQDGQSLYLWNGRAAGFLDDETLYTYAGRYIGWLEDGWIRDAQGLCLLFESDAIRGPAKPKLGAKATPGARGPRPARGELDIAPPRPSRSDGWSASAFIDLV